METESINIWAVLVAALANFLIGGLWYSPALFGKAWMKANNFTDTDLQKGSPAVIFGVSALFSFIMATNLAFFLAGPEPAPPGSRYSGVRATGTDPFGERLAGRCGGAELDDPGGHASPRPSFS